MAPKVVSPAKIDESCAEMWTLTKERCLQPVNTAQHTCRPKRALKMYVYILYYHLPGGGDFLDASELLRYSTAVLPFSVVKICALPVCSDGIKITGSCACRLPQKIALHVRRPSAPWVRLC